MPIKCYLDVSLTTRLTFVVHYFKVFTDNFMLVINVNDNGNNITLYELLLRLRFSLNKTSLLNLLRTYMRRRILIPETIPLSKISKLLAADVLVVLLPVERH